MSVEDSRYVFDEVIHGQVRLRICSLLRQFGLSEFGFLRQSLGISDSTLSKHLKSLNEAGYVALTKKTVETRSKTWAALTFEGEAAFDGHVSFLQEIIDSSRKRH
ncbi:transcriptional regulator [Arthrobacter sp. M2012083]|uniref:transcriptional regulator n=1 Tax=Arthrobacter sp. M2012083 TaxID=1197706 RepID=UPI0005CAD797|nr:transcriptional regulator [Arthrobacter sp. M2012083]